MRVIIKNFGSNDQVAIYVPTLEISVHMLKRLLLRDYSAMKQLGISAETKKELFTFQIGSLLDTEIAGDAERPFSVYPLTESLSSLGIQADGVVYLFRRKELS